MAATPRSEGNDRNRRKRKPQPSGRKPAARKGTSSAPSGRPGTGPRHAQTSKPQGRRTRAALGGGFVGTDVDFADGRMVLKNPDLLQELAAYFGETEATHSALIRLSLSGGVQQPNSDATVDARC